MSPHNQAEDSSHEHKSKASRQGAVKLALVTVSDSRSVATDKNGQYLTEKIKSAGHEPVSLQIVKDEPDQIECVLAELVASAAQIIIFNGGTGISKRDRTFDVIDTKFEKRLVGFGELFRMLSYHEVGAASMLSRACAGVYKDKVIISLPGSPNAVQLAWEKLIEPELNHLAWEVLR